MNGTGGVGLAWRREYRSCCRFWVLSRSSSMRNGDFPLHSVGLAMIRIKVNVFYESKRFNSRYGPAMLCILCRGHVLNQYDLFVNRR